MSSELGYGWKRAANAGSGAQVIAHRYHSSVLNSPGCDVLIDYSSPIPFRVVS